MWHSRRRVRASWRKSFWSQLQELRRCRPSLPWGQVSAMEFDIGLGAFWLEVFLDCFKRMNSMDGSIVHILFFQCWVCSVFSNSRYLNEVVDLLVPLEPVIGIAECWNSVLERVKSKSFNFCNGRHGEAGYSSSLRNSSPGELGMVEGPESGELTEHSFRPKNSRLDTLLSRFKAMKGLRSLDFSVGDWDGGEDFVSGTVCCFIQVSYGWEKWGNRGRPTRHGELLCLKLSGLFGRIL